MYPISFLSDIKTENVHPPRYNQYSIETLEMMRRIWGNEATIMWCEMTAFKYRMRLGHKDNIESELEKESFYLNYAKRLKGERDE